MNIAEPAPLSCMGFGLVGTDVCDQAVRQWSRQIGYSDNTGGSVDLKRVKDRHNVIAHEHFGIPDKPSSRDTG